MKKELIIYQGKNGEIEFGAIFKKKHFEATQSQIADLLAQKDRLLLNILKIYSLMKN